MHETVAALCSAYCARFDTHNPGVLAGLYLVGSIALGDYRPGHSDVDFIAVLDRALGHDDIVSLHKSLQSQFARPHFDGIYVDADALTRDPRQIAPGFSIIDGQVRGPDREERHPVTWLTLARHGIAIRGRVSSPDWIWTDLAAARQHARDNQRTYWQKQLDWHRLQQKLHAPLSDDALVWAVLGVGRLHALIVKGLLLSKGQTAGYERAAFPAYGTLIMEAATLRTGLRPTTSFKTPSARYAAMVDFLDLVITDALARSG